MSAWGLAYYRVPPPHPCKPGHGRAGRGPHTVGSTIGNCWTFTKVQYTKCLTLRSFCRCCTTQDIDKASGCGTYYW